MDATPHPTVSFFNEINGRYVWRCYRTHERADEDIADYRPFNNTRVEPGTCDKPCFARTPHPKGTP